jgi:MFS family permease
MASWLAAAGAFVVSLDSMMNIAFPSIAAGLAVPAESMRWVIICYVGVYALTAFAGGALADLVGHVRVFRVGIALSALALLAGGLSPSLGVMLWARVAQGVAGGLVYGTAPGIVTLAAAPDQRGRALGRLSAAIALGLALGPLVAGVLVDLYGWRSVFHARAPLAALVFLGLFGSGVPVTGAPAAAGVRRLVGVTDLRRPPVPLMCSLAFLANAAIFSIWLLGGFYLIDRRGYSAGVAGAVFMLTPLGTSIAAPLAGRIADRLGAGAPLAAGLVLQTLGLAGLAAADVATPVTLVALALFTSGFGLGVFQVPMMTRVMAAFPSALQGAAGGLTFLARTLGTVAGVSVLAALFAARRQSAGFDRAFHEAFVVATLFVAIAAVTAVVAARRLPGTRAR